MDGEKLASSSLILADMIEKVPTKSIGTGQFVIGDSKVRPRVDDTFKRDEKMGIYFKFYNFAPGREDPEAGRPDPVRGDQERHQREDLRIHRGRGSRLPGASTPGDDREAPAAEEPGAGAVYDPAEGYGQDPKPDA